MMKSLRYALTALCVLGSCAAFGQKETGAAQFPELSPDVRSAAMGNSGVAADPTAFSIYRNAAASLFSGKKVLVGYSYTPWMHELSTNNLHVLGASWQMDRKQGFLLGARWFSHDKISLGKDEGTFRPYDLSVDFGYARKLTDALSASATVRYVRSDMSAVDDDAVANAVAFDLGLYYRGSMSRNEMSYWAVALQASNFGTRIDYGYGKYDQESKVTMGGVLNYAYTEDHVFQASLDVAYRVQPEGCLMSGFGLEYNAFGFASVRGGYHWGEENNRMQRYGTLGCGVNYKGVELDFSYLLPETDSFLKNTWQLAVSYAF